MEVIQPTLAASLAVILYVVIEKIVVPLVKGKTNGRNGKNGNGDKHQEYINRTIENRLDGHSHQLNEHRNAIAEVGAAIKVVHAIVERIEKRLDE